MISDVNGFQAATLRREAERSGGVPVLWQGKVEALVCKESDGIKELRVGEAAVGPIEAVKAWRLAIEYGIMILLNREIL